MMLLCRFSTLFLFVVTFAVADRRAENDPVPGPADAWICDHIDRTEALGGGQVGSVTLAQMRSVRWREAPGYQNEEAVDRTLRASVRAGVKSR